MNEYPHEWPGIARRVKQEAGWKCIRCRHPHDRASAHVLTVHHWDNDKANCLWWNLMALCQRCHLSVQGLVDPNEPFMFEHEEWCKPYAAGLYAWKYKKQWLSREQVMAQLEELLALERIV